MALRAAVPLCMRGPCHAFLPKKVESLPYTLRCRLQVTNRLLPSLYIVTFQVIGQRSGLKNVRRGILVLEEG